MHGGAVCTARREQWERDGQGEKMEQEQWAVTAGINGGEGVGGMHAGAAGKDGGEGRSSGWISAVV